jgi:hypothetical protein
MTISYTVSWHNVRRFSWRNNYTLNFTVVGANLWVRHPLEVKSMGIRRVGGVADKEAYAVHTINIISQRQFFGPSCLSSCVSNVIGLHSSYKRLFPFYPQASDVDETHSLVPGIVNRIYKNRDRLRSVLQHSFKLLQNVFTCKRINSLEASDVQLVKSGHI